MMVNMACQEVEVKTEKVNVMKQSIEQTETMIKTMTDSFVSVGNGIKDDIALLAQALSECPTTTANFFTALL